MDDFSAILEACDSKFGAIDEPSPESEVIVTTAAREITCDVVGITEDADTTVVYLFEWKQFDRDNIERLAEKHGEPMEVIEQEIDFDEDIIVQTGIVPMDKVNDIELDTGAAFE